MSEPKKVKLDKIVAEVGGCVVTNGDVLKLVDALDDDDFRSIIDERWIHRYRELAKLMKASSPPP
jgi:hypothetical protein